MDRSRLSLVFAISTLGLALSAAPSFAIWPHTPAANLPVNTLPGDQYSVCLSADRSGGAYLAWTDPRNDAADIYATHVTGIGGLDPTWPINGSAVCVAASLQLQVAIATDGANGAFVTWMDLRAGTQADYVQHLLPTGVDPAWPVNGRAVTPTATSQFLPHTVPDGLGGVIVAWQDQRPASLGNEIYAQHILANGQVDAAWPATGLVVCTAANDQNLPVPVSDGLGGAVVTWQDGRAGNNDIYAQHVRLNGTVDPAWPANGRAVCSNPADQIAPAILADGSGGAIVAWADLRGAAYDIYAAHVLASGAIDTNYPPDGRLVCSAANDQKNPTMLADGAGGAFIGWEDGRLGAFARNIFVTRLLFYGVVDPAWTANGLALTSGVFDHLYPSLVPDGATGFLATWMDGRTTADIFAAHVRVDGTLDPAWPASGKPVASGPGQTVFPSAVTDGNGGLIAAWNDDRTGGFDIYAQRMARGGVLGTPEPIIESVLDIPNDQGVAVDVAFDASWLDLANDPNLVYYEIYRGLPAGAAQEAMRKGARVRPTFAEAPAEPGAIVAPDGAQGYAWQYVGALNPVHFLPTYAFLTYTLGDSVAGSNPKTAFMVVARDGSGLLYWLSPPDSGYSVDNLAPNAPSPFVGVYGGGSSNLSWGTSTAYDFASFKLYRGKTPGFTPSGGTLVTSTTLTSYTDHPGEPYYYKLSAVDIHGNESPYALVLPTGALAVDETAPRALALERPNPNPARSTATLGFTLPRAARARLAVFDLSGRRIVELADGAFAAGDHPVRWDLRGVDGARVADGLYFVRLEAEGATRVERLAVAR